MLTAMAVLATTTAPTGASTAVPPPGSGSPPAVAAPPAVTGLTPPFGQLDALLPSAPLPQPSSEPRQVAQLLSSPDLRAAELRFISRINDERRAQGLRALTENAQMTRIAREWSGVMLRERNLYHNPRLASQVQGPWTSLGENVGRGLLHGVVTVLDRVEHLHGLFLNSAGHRANILGAWNQVGAGVAHADDGTMWVAVTFLQGPTGAFPLFQDAAGSTHEASINALWLRGVVDPCMDGTRYCPGRNTTRAEMATFVARAIGLTPRSDNRFIDVSGPHAGNINALAAAGIVRGCAENRFCPDQGVTRAQMATFMVNASPQLSPMPGSRFTDVTPGAVHSDNINGLAAAGVTLGCTPDQYCPRANVTRAQIASFLARAFPG